MIAITLPFKKNAPVYMRSSHELEEVREREAGRARTKERTRANVKQD